VRHVVLEFNDNEAAEAFIKKLAELQDVDNRPKEDEVPYLAMGLAMASAAYCKVVRVFAYPTITCTCDNGESHHGDIGISKKYGWMVHRKCGKPTTYWLGGAKLKYRTVDGWQNVAGIAKDLLPTIMKED
jgi:hypothetical protein